MGGKNPNIFGEGVRKIVAPAYQAANQGKSNFRLKKEKKVVKGDQQLGRMKDLRGKRKTLKEKEPAAALKRGWGGEVGEK